ncbi:MAG TPA: Ni/Fe-hydrogenase, b-type cytochrome subunit [Geobacteraceae bacterium]|nr:Ni/Fe-hydrogenase, b-type cytochrome subunit [Geobacteraceae bacterium]
MSKLVIKYVWEIPVRVTHWLNVVAILTLTATGLFIAYPMSLGNSPSDFVMGWVRFIHFVTAYVFAIGLAARAYWSFAGNKYSNWRTFFPYLNPADRQRMWATLRYYTFLDRRLPHVVGHNSVAAAAYFLVFLLYLGMICTGFALYSEHAPGGFYAQTFGWLTHLFSNQTLRLLHHCFMWLILGFAIQHVYSCWLMDIKERGGIISSMFSGYKSIEEE